MPLASDVRDRARTVYLNDPLGRNYTDAIILPFIQAAADELQNELVAHGTGVVEEFSAPLVVAPAAGAVPSISDMIQPIDVWEAASPVFDYWQIMTEGEFQPLGAEIRTILGMWKWREEVITVPPPSVARQVTVYYYKRAIPAVLAMGTSIPVVDALNFLSARTASLGAATIGRKFDLAEALGNMADTFKQVLLGTAVKEEQDQPVRPQPFKG
jgi:hypothetical protein